METKMYVQKSGTYEGNGTERNGMEYPSVLADRLNEGISIIIFTNLNGRLRG